MSRLDNQRRLFLELVETLRPHWRSDPGLPARLQTWLTAKRAGSRDRRLYRELTYTALRVLPWIEPAPPEALVAIVATVAAVTPATAAFIETYRLPHLPPTLDAAALLPPWLADECPATTEPRQRDALLARAPLWIRWQQGDRATLEAELSTAGWRVTPSAVLPTAWRLEGEADITTTAAYRNGEIEIQDLGSQLLLASVRPDPGQHWLDACAGAGGKTLQLSQLLGVTGRVTAHDVRTDALRELRLRATRARRRNIEIAPPQGAYDGVLVDAPCTGSGTWRRAPHLKWTTGPEDIARAARRQFRLLEQYSRHVRPGGQLVYATCSLCRSENESVVAAFLEAHPHFQPEPIAPPAPLSAGQLGLTILSADVDSDAFFVSRLRRV